MIEKSIIDSFDEKISKTNNPLLKTARNIFEGLVGVDLDWHEVDECDDTIGFFFHKGSYVLELYIYEDKVDVWYFCPFGDNQIRDVKSQLFLPEQNDEIVKYIKLIVK